MEHTVAMETLRQLGGAGRLVAMIGAHNFVASDRNISFRFKARGRDGINGLHIGLDASDTYRIEFVRVTSKGRVVKDEMTDVYCDQIKAVIEQRIGLYLSF